MPKSVNYEDEATAVLAAGGPAQPPRRSRRVASCLVTMALLVNTALLIAILGAVMHIKFRVDQTVDQAENIIQSVKSGHPTPEVVEYTTRLFASATGAFFFGSADGTVPGFLQDLFRFDFRGLGTSFVSFTTKFMQAFQAAPPPTASCHAANGGLGCASPYIYNGLSAVQSVATRVANFTNVQANAASSPAMSDGLLRLDTLLTWLNSQANVTAWKVASGVCNSFATQVAAVQWYGSFVDSDGSVHSWDARSEIEQISWSVKEVCGRIWSVTP